MVDSKGVLWQGSGDEDRNPYKREFFRETKARDLADAMKRKRPDLVTLVKTVVQEEQVKWVPEGQG